MVSHDNIRIKMKLIRTNPSHPAYEILIPELDAELAVRDGDDHDFYHQFNHSDTIKHVIIALDGEIPVGCGAIKEFEEFTVEIKRMFTRPAYRGKGIASLLLNELESWAAELGYTRCILETGVNQPEAISLYQKLDYQRIPNYAQYAGVEASLCFEKRLRG